MIFGGASPAWTAPVSSEIAFIMQGSNPSQESLMSVIFLLKKKVLISRESFQQGSSLILQFGPFEPLAFLFILLIEFEVAIGPATIQFPPLSSLNGYPSFSSHFSSARFPCSYGLSVWSHWMKRLAYIFNWALFINPLFFSFSVFIFAHHFFTFTLKLSLQNCAYFHQLNFSKSFS